MLENSFGLNFFLKTPRKKTSIRYIYLRITVDGIPKETSLKRTWDSQQAEVATYDPDTGEEVITLEELVPIFSNRDIDKTAQQFVDVGQDPEFTSILVTVEGTFALRIGNSDAVRNFDGLMSQVRAAKKQFFKDFDNAVNIPCQGQPNGCYVENFSDFLNDYEINGGKIGLILFKAVEDNQGNITNWVKL